MDQVDNTGNDKDGGECDHDPGDQPGKSVVDEKLIRTGLVIDDLDLFTGFIRSHGDAYLTFRRDPPFIAGHEAYDGVAGTPTRLLSGDGSMVFKNDAVGLYAVFSDFLFGIPKIAAE